MKKAVLFFWLLLFIVQYGVASASQTSVAVLCYHHVGPYAEEGNKANVYTVSQQTLRAHFDYLRNNGFNVISLDDYIQFAKGQKILPDKSVLITFDDAYVSFYEQVFPMLKEYKFPAVLAMVGIWQEVAPSGPDRIISWAQAREMSKSGLVEIASHSYGLHYQFPMNAYGDVGHAATTRAYAKGGFESEDSYKRRIQADLKKSQEVFERELGRKGRVLVWPYGEHNEITVEIALAEGFEVTFGLEGGFNYPGEQSIKAGKRGIIWGNPAAPDFAKFLKYGGDEEQKLRALQIDLDAIFDTDKTQFEANINMVIDRIRKTNANAVFLQAFADDKGDGDIHTVYFSNSIAPVKADVFSHVVRRLDDVGVRVFAWVPTLAGQWLTDQHPEDLIQAYDKKGKGWYRRATPFSPRVKESLKNLFAEMAMFSPVTGVLFQDDLFMTDYEDFSPAARKAFFDRFSIPLTSDALKNNAIRKEWTKMKSDAMNDLTRELFDVVRHYRPNCLSARNIYAEAVINPDAFEWYAQDYREYLKTYNYTVIMAYPYMEKKADRAVPWLKELADAALADKVNAQKVMFKLQNYDWSKKKWVPRAEISEQIRALRAKGVLHFGYYPENLFSERHDESPF